MNDSQGEPRTVLCSLCVWLPLSRDPDGEAPAHQQPLTSVMSVVGARGQHSGIPAQECQ